MKEVTFRKA